MKNALIFNLGDETRPKIENIKDKESYEDSFFFDAYEKAFGLINEILTHNKQEKDDYFFEFAQERNNIIAFVGDRGTGKTSCMKTIYRVLKDDYADGKIKDPYCKFSTLPTIDPSYFEERSNILEIVVAHMFDNFKVYATNPNASRDRHTSEYMDRKNELIKRFQEVKNCLDTINEKPKISNDSIEELSGLARGINLKKSMKELIDCYLGYFDKTVLAIAIDDIDLQTRYAYKMVEQIRKYLIIPNVIILTGVKLPQLNDLIKQNYYQEYKDLIKKEQLSDTTENMSGRYLSKLIPYNHRIFLPDIEQRFDQEMIILNHNQSYFFESISSAVLKLIFCKTRYVFYNSDIKGSFIIPRNLRDLLNLISLLFHMENITQENSELNKINLRKNRILFKTYFIDTWCSENLPANMFSFIKELETLEVTSINKRVIDFLLQIGVKEIHFESAITYKGNRSYNISLSDVDYVLDKLSNNYEIQHIDQFVFALKTIYSMLLYQLFEDKKEDMEFRKSNLCLQYELQRIDKHKKHQKNTTKLMTISNYEKLLGGNLLRVADLFIPSNIAPDTESSNNAFKTNKKALVFSNQYLHIRKINNNILNALYKFSLDPKSKDSYLAEYKNMNADVAFKICEFFILTSYLNTNNPYFRSQKRCYYFHMPYSFPINFETEIVYSSTSILFNIVKFYNHYRLYHLINLDKKEFDEMGKRNWGKFWQEIESKKEDSLIYQILHFNISNEPTAKQFENKHIEKIFIRNMEVLDILQDFMPYLKSKYKKEDNESNLNIITSYFKKLSQFQFYLYPKELTEGETKSHNTLNDNEEVSFDVFKIVSDFLTELKGSDMLKIFEDILFVNE